MMAWFSKLIKLYLMLELQFENDLKEHAFIKMLEIKVDRLVHFIDMYLVIKFNILLV